MSQASIPRRGPLEEAPPVHLCSSTRRQRQAGSNAEGFAFARVRTGGNSREFLFPGWRKQSRCSQRSTLRRHSAAACSFCFLCATTCATLHQCHCSRLSVPDHSRPWMPAQFLQGQVLPCNKLSRQRQLPPAACLPGGGPPRVTIACTDTA